MQRGLMNPLTPGQGTPACNTGSKTVDPQCFNVDYRCIARDVTCDNPMNTTGKKANCSERTDTFLNPISQYVNFFASLPNPNLVIAGIWTPTMLDNIASSPATPGQLFVDFVNGGTDSAALNRGRKLEAACYNPDPTLTSDMANGFFGQAQLRLSTFIRNFQAANISENSICDAANYPTALDKIAQNIKNAFNVDCMASPPKLVNGVPECIVGYVDASNQKSTPDVTLPVCSAKCCNYFATDSTPNAANDPLLMPNQHKIDEAAACSSDPDCYCAVPSKVNCGAGAVVGLWRAGQAAPPSGKVVTFNCGVQSTATM